MTVAELLTNVVDSQIAEAEFAEEFFKLLRAPHISHSEAQCLNELVDDVNMAEHISPLFQRGFVWKVEECLRLLTSGTSAPEIRRFFATNRAP